MTVSTTTARVSYAGNGSTVTFNVGFYFLADSHLKVTLRAADGTETVKTLTTDYTVSGAGNPSGGSITLGTAPASGVTVVVTRNVPQTQLVDYQPNDPFPATTHEQALDQLTMEVQQLQEQVTRAIKLSTTNTMTSTEFTVGATNRANKVFGFDANGELVVSQELGTYRGNWASGTAYQQRDIIKDTSNSNIYICLTAHTSTGAQPISTNTDSAKWGLIVDAAAAATSASNAASSASAAATSATNAATSATNASSSASSASTSASTATTQASNASSSASSASTSATNAASSATAAAGSATSASNSAAAAAAAAASGLYSAVIDKSANYTVVAGDAGDLIRVSTGSGAVTITLPQISTVSDGFKIAIVKWTGDTNAVTIARSGSDTINGATSALISSQYTQTTFVADFETNQWFAATSGLGSTNVLVDRFSGNASTTAFTLSGSPGALNNTYVYVGGVYQQKNTYTLSGTTLTFSSAPPSGTNNIEVVWTQPLSIGTPSDGTVSPAKVQSGVDFTFNGLTVGKGAGAVSTNTAVGASALAANTTASNNVSVGYQSGYNTTTGGDNTTIGYQSGNNIQTGAQNTLLGSQAGGNTSGGYNYNTGVGYRALYNVSSGSNNVTIGNLSMADCTTSSSCVGVGDASLRLLTTGSNNVAVGQAALRSNTTASSNTAAGYHAGYSNSTGTSNTFLGESSGYGSTGSQNAFVGAASGYSNTGSYNTFVGYLSGYYVTSGAKNSILGAYNGNQGGIDIRTANNNIVLSDGDGNPKLAYIDANSAWSTGTFPLSTTSPHFDFSGTYGTYGCTYTTGQYPIHNVYSGGATEKFLQFRWNNSTVGQITSNGTTTTYATSSDYRLKDVSGDLTGYKERITALQPKQGSWKLDGSEFRGFLAHDFALSYPTSVSGAKDAVDEDGNPEYQSMQAGSAEVIADLVAYIKELETRLVALENK